MKILFIAPGNDIHAIRWINRIANQGIDSVLLNSIPNFELLGTSAKVINSEDPYFRAGIKLSRSPISTFRRYLFFRRVIKDIIVGEKPDLIHLHWLFDVPQLAAAKIANIPIISTPYGSDLLLYSKPTVKGIFKYYLNHKFTKDIVNNSNFFCCDAEHLKKRLIQLKAKPENIEIIYFGTDVSEFSPKLRSKDYKAKLGIPEENLIVLSNRGLSEIYDVKTFILAAERVLGLYKNLTFLIAGGGPLLDELKILAERLNLTGSVIFLGRLDDEEFALATGNSDIYVSTSTSDGGLAASVAEAMACSIPVIITEFGDNSKWLDDNSAGLAFEIGNHEELASLILKLASDSELRRTMGARAREIICESNNSETETSRVVNLYKKALNQN